MEENKINKILKNSIFSMQMEGFTIDSEQKETVRKILNGELDKEIYFSSVREKAMRYANEV